MTDLRKVLVPLAGLGAVGGLLVGVWMGLVRIGWSLGSPPPLGLHAPMLALGALGTLIGLERAVAVNRPWAGAGPPASAAAVGAMVVGLPAAAAAVPLTAGGLVLVAVFAVAHRLRPGAHLVVMGAGAAAWVVAAAAWGAGSPPSRLVPLLAAFLVLTIAGERLELARLGVGAVARLWFLAAAVGVAGGAVATLAAPASGPRLAGLGLLGLAAWLARHDVARRTIRLGGSARHMAAALLAGYAWVAFAGALWVLGALTPGRPAYDAAVHAVFLGFVMSMVFAHATIVLPSVAGLALPWRPAQWVPLALLHASLVLRVVGDLAGDVSARRWGGMFNAVALAVFVLLVAFTVARTRLRART